MIADDWASLAYGLTFLVLLGSALLVEYSGRGGLALRQIALWVVIFSGVALAANLWLDRQSEPRITDSGRIEIPASPNGHFYLTAEANGAEVEFMVDTGASMIVLTREDTRRIGMDPDQLNYIGRASTANGIVQTAPVTIQEFRIADMVDTNVSASVNEGELSDSLLGMSYLRRFARVSFEGDLMILER